MASSHFLEAMAPGKNLFSGLSSAAKTTLGQLSTPVVIAVLIAERRPNTGSSDGAVAEVLAGGLPGTCSAETVPTAVHARTATARIESVGTDQIKSPWDLEEAGQRRRNRGT